MDNPFSVGGPTPPPPGVAGMEKTKTNNIHDTTRLGVHGAKTMADTVHEVDLDSETNADICVNKPHSGKT